MNPTLINHLLNSELLTMMKKPTLLLLSALMIASCTKTTPISETEVDPTPPPASTDVTPNTALLLGVDANNNGIRDSVEEYIDTIVLNDKQKAVTEYSAKVLQNTILIDTNDEVALKASGEQQMKYIACMALRFDDYEQNEMLLDLITQQTMDTQERYDAYERYNAAQFGSTTPIPSGNPCDNI